MTSFEQKLIRKLFKTILYLFLTILLWLAVRWFVYEPYVIPSGSMIPTLMINDQILVSKWDFGLRLPFSKNWIVKWRKPLKGEVIVFHAIDGSDKMLIKRVVGMPGETIEGVTLDKDQYFMMGDNRDNSLDSRVWGPITSSDIVGKARYIWLSCEHTLPALPFICDPKTISWNRMFKSID